MSGIVRRLKHSKFSHQKQQHLETKWLIFKRGIFHNGGIVLWFLIMCLVGFLSNHVYLSNMWFPVPKQRLPNNWSTKDFYFKSRELCQSVKTNNSCPVTANDLIPPTAMSMTPIGVSWPFFSWATVTLWNKQTQTMASLQVVPWLTDFEIKRFLIVSVHLWYLHIIFLCIILCTQRK